MTPFWLASPPLVAVRLMPSDTSNTWKMMTVAMRVIAMVTSSSTMLMPRCRLREGRRFMAQGLMNTAAITR